ncbi:MAG: RlpA-like double-psi beta-barrel domain-containing protein [Solirubrobacterales bacterium]|nr:RlpA-like double-psi beta-barrel domain-containing protein [Solirubrobacterales bacterium]
MTKSRRSRLGIGALMIGIPAAAAAMAAGQAFAAPAQAPLHINSSSGRIAYGRNVVVTGAESSSHTGHTVVLEFARRGATVWSQLGSATVDGAGAFQVAARLDQSGLVRVLDASSGSVTAFVAHARGNRSGGAATSAPVPVDVAARIRVPSRGINVLAGQAVQVRGWLLPAARGRKVSLQARRSGSWHTLATARTGSAGRFVLRYVAGSAGQQPIRVRFAGDRLNAGSITGPGQLTVFRAAEASWYNDGGNTACGFHAGDGVANRTLPCGTTVVFRYGGRTVTATVDDRGPFAGGRDWDLNQNTAAALGFRGVGQVWSSR